MTLSAADWAIIGVYLVGCVAAGVWMKRYVRRVEDFAIAGREMDVYLGVASLAATEVGIVTIMYTAEMGFTNGPAGATPGVLTALAMFLVGLTGFVISPMRNAGVMTIPELLEKRFGVGVRWLAGLVIILGGVLNMGIFLRLGGEFLVHLIGLPQQYLELTMTALLALVLLYTVLGGMLSVLVTDYLQFLVMGMGIVITSVLVLWHTPWPVFTQQLAQAHQAALAAQEQQKTQHAPKFPVPAEAAGSTKETVSSQTDGSGGGTGSPKAAGSKKAGGSGGATGPMESGILQPREKHSPLPSAGEAGERSSPGEGDKKVLFSPSPSQPSLTHQEKGENNHSLRSAEKLPESTRSAIAPNGIPPAQPQGQAQTQSLPAGGGPEASLREAPNPSPAAKSSAGKSLADQINSKPPPKGMKMGNPFNPIGEGGLGWMWVLWQAMTALAVVTTWQTTIARVLAARDARTAKRIYRRTAFYFVGRFALPGLWGAAAFLYFWQQGGLPEGVNTLQAMPRFLATLLPAGLLGLVVAAMLAAEMSTDSGYLLTWATVIYNDLLMPLVRRKPSEKVRLLIIRTLVVLIGLFLVFYGLWYPLPGKAWDYLAVTGNIYLASLFTLLVGALYWPAANRIGAIAAIILGTVGPISFLIINAVAPEESPWRISPEVAGLAAFGCAFVGMIFGSLVGRWFLPNAAGLTNTTTVHRLPKEK